MKTVNFSIQAAVLIAALTCGAALRADNLPAVRYVDDRHGEIVPGPFRDSTEAHMLRDAYIILANGDHDYNGHRVGAMQQVRSAADSLGVDIHGDGFGGKPQPLSDVEMRHAKELLVHVREAAAVKDQKRIVKHLNEAVHQINIALGIK